jgi:ATP-dependent helicase Lhr and Lhr-like helicase
MADHRVLEGFSPAVREWFATSFPEPTAAQVQGWPVITGGSHTLICAPTGSGKTLTAFLSSIDRLVTTAPPEPGDSSGRARTRVLYISPLRALAFDVEKNLRTPLLGIRYASERLEVPFVEPVVAMRTGDTSAKDRQALIRRPPDLLITTPESLYLMLTSSARDTLANVDTVIIDEIHALAATKRGAHLMLSLERLEEITRRPPQRIGLSATQRPLEEVARFLGGYRAPGQPRPVTIVDAGVRKQLEVQVVVPVEDMGQMGQMGPPELQSGPATAALVPRRSSIWPSVYPRILEAVLAHHTTIIFCNARRQAERLAAKLNELAESEGIGVDPDTGLLVDDLVKAHHGSLAREQRVVIEDQLKRGDLRAIVATSSLELGIDMGAVDQVIQVESPGAVSRGLQRIGRAGHSVGEPSKGLVFPKHRGDLLEAAIVTRRMIDGLIEHTRYLRNPLDVLAQQIVAHVAITGDVSVDDIGALVRRSAGFADLSDDLLVNVLDLLAGRYPSDEFNELRPRLVWDRVANVLRARDGSRRLAVTSGGTIPDRGLFGVFLPDGTRVGELDEEMVYESRPGETFLLGASTWRIEDITFERVTVTPAPGQPGKMPFWRGDRPGRPLELGRALGAFVREVREADPAAAHERLREHYGLDNWAADNVMLYLDEQAEATGVVPDDRTVVIERFRDEIGDWRVCILTPFGTPVHAPWAMAIERRLVDHFDIPVETMWGDDGIVIRLPESADHLPLEELLIDPEEIDELVVATLPQTSLFSARFRECAGRALLLPRRRPDRRTPLWQQRQRAADLLAVASKYPTFPILLETSRECLQDVFDVPALREVLGQLRSRAIRVVNVDTNKASPFAQSLLFNWIAAYMYEGDAPLAERRAAALALDRDLLRDLLGAEELRELLDPGVLADVELELQCLTDGRRARTVDELHDVLRKVGDLTLAEVDLRIELSPSPGDAGSAGEGAATGTGSVAAGWLEQLVRERRAFEVRLPGVGAANAHGGGGQGRADDTLVRWAAAEDAARYRDAFGVALPLGLPRAFTEPVPQPLETLVARYARTHAPFTADEVARRFGTTVERVQGALAALEQSDRVVHGEFRPDGAAREFCDVDVLRQLRRRSLATLRREVEPVEPDALARFLPAWHGIPAQRGGIDQLVESLGVLQGAALVASSLETHVLPLRVQGYRPTDLDELCTSGEVVWIGSGAIGSTDGRIRLFFADQLPLLAAGLEPSEAPAGQLHDRVRELLAARGAVFWAQIREADPVATDAELLAALWDLVWAGEVTNDSLAPLRAVIGGARAKPGSAAAARSRNRPRPGRLNRIGPPAGAGRWSLVAPMLDPRPSSTVAAHAVATQLLERHGVLTREAALAEGVVGGFSAVYGVLKVLEERGQTRRGYFVSGLGAAQFSLPGAVDRLRSVREVPDHDDTAPLVLAATDPAQPYGSTLSWPDSLGRPARSAGALVVLSQGHPLVWFDPRSHHLVTFPSAHDVVVPAGDAGPLAQSMRSSSGTAHPGAVWATALADLVHSGRLRSAEVRKVDGSPVDHTSPVVAALRAAGFADGYRGLTLRR